MVRKIIILILSIFLIACSKPLHKNKFVVAGTYLEVTSPNSEAAGIVYAEFRRLEKIFDSFDPQSEISGLNKTYNTPHKVSKELVEILKAAKEVANLTNGAFDVSRGVLYNFWKNLIKKKEIAALPSPELVEQIRNLGGIDDFELDFEAQTVKINKKGVVIDLGGIAKGFMVDKAIIRLKEKGIKSALVNAGGDMYCLGLKDKQPWRVGIRDSESAEGFIEVQSLVDQAIATSGNYEQFFYHQGKRYSHLIDPRGGYPVSNNIVSVSVISDDCLMADSLATAFFIFGIEETKKFLAETTLNLKVFVITEGPEGRNIIYLGEDRE